MRVRRLFVLGSLLFLLTSDVRATDHVFDLFIAPSYLRAKGSDIDLGGWQISGAATLKKEPRLSFIADISAHFFGSHDEEDVTQLTFMGGPRWTFLGKHRGNLFVHAVFLGAVYRNDVALNLSSTSGAVSVGGGLDFIIPKVTRSWGLRGQVDYIIPVGTGQANSTRVSLGAVYRFHGKHDEEDDSEPCPCGSGTPDKK